MPLGALHAQLVQSANGGYQADFGQCGGADGYCAGVQGLRCADEQWLACAPTSSCARITSLYWQVGMLRFLLNPSAAICQCRIRSSGQIFVLCLSISPAATSHP